MIPTNGISFFTNCYEADWEQLLLTDRLEKMIERCSVNFAFRGLIVNNVCDRGLVSHFATKAVEAGIIDGFYFSEDITEKMLNVFEIKRSSFYCDLYDGYWYSMGPLSAIYLCPTEFLMYFTCDCMIDERGDATWVPSAIDLLRKYPGILIANPTWDGRFDAAKSESDREDTEWYYGAGFSDQCFLVAVGRLRGGIYNFKHRDSERYPVYAGNLFEKRVDSFMRKNNLLRITHKRAFYWHEKLGKQAFEKITPGEMFRKRVRFFLGNNMRKIRIKIS